MCHPLPYLYYFNPTCDIASANNTPSFKPNQTLRQFENDLAFLPAYLAKPTDVVLMPEYEDLAFVEFLYQVGFRLPGQVLRSDIWQEHQKILSDIHGFKPWGWALNMIHRFKKIPHLNTQKALPKWDDALRNSLSRLSAQKVLTSVLENAENNIYISDTPQILSTLQEVEDYLKKNTPIVLKEPWSSSARGNMLIQKPYLDLPIKQRIKSVLSKQGFWMGEKWFHKQLDFSLHFQLKNGQVRLTGESYFETNPKGQYQASYIHQKPPMDKATQAFLEDNLPQVKQALIKALSQNKDLHWYEGNFGIDLMLVSENNRLCFHPCVEINLRNTMGTVALFLEQQIHPEAKGKFYTFFDVKQRFDKAFKDSWTYQLSDNLLISGRIPLVSPENKQFGAVLSLT